jgi:hypothetical protein
MTLFLGTLLITVACCLAMGAGLWLGGGALQGGCGQGDSSPGRCLDCPRRNGEESVDLVQRGE